MKMKVFVCLVVTFMIFVSFSGNAVARSRSSDLIRQGLLGAGAGAVGGAASGAKGRDVWKGALAGVGVNIIGGALLDAMSGEKVERVESVDASSPRTAYSDGYEAGYANGYKQGYTEGFKDGIRESNISR